MNKLIIIFLVMTSSFKGTGQSKYGFETGVDSTALSFKIRTQKIYDIWIDSLKIDTISLRTEIFDINGYIVKIEYLNWEDRFRKSGLFSNYFVEFQYNGEGYLISENLNWMCPRATYGPDTIWKVKTETWNFINDSEFLKSSETISYYPNESEWTEKCSYFYFDDGREQEIRCEYFSKEDDSFWRRTKFEYFENGLLKESYMENSKLIFSRKCFEYEYFN